MRVDHTTSLEIPCDKFFHVSSPEKLTVMVRDEHREEVAELFAKVAQALGAEDEKPYEFTVYMCENTGERLLSLDDVVARTGLKAKEVKDCLKHGRKIGGIGYYYSPMPVTTVDCMGDRRSLIDLAKKEGLAPIEVLISLRNSNCIGDQFYGIAEIDNIPILECNRKAKDAYTVRYVATITGGISSMTVYKNVLEGKSVGGQRYKLCPPGTKVIM